VKFFRLLSGRHFFSFYPSKLALAECPARRYEKRRAFLEEKSRNGKKEENQKKGGGWGGSNPPITSF
jgi:hypothetical protein